jgi:hypothetical protein
VHANYEEEEGLHSVPKQLRSNCNEHAVSAVQNMLLM